MVRLSNDNGKTWVKVRRLPGGYVGPVRNKPVELKDGTILCGASTETEGWRVHMEWCRDPFGLWGQGPDLNKAVTVAAIQPTILLHDDGLQILCRTKQGRIYQAWGKNGYYYWTPMERTVLPNPNSAVDAVVLKDQRALLVYNHSSTSRDTLNVAVSPGGRDWQAACVIEKEAGSEFSYPAVIQTKDGLVHATYTWKRQKIRHVVMDPKLMTPRAMPDGRWP
jgi:predicted neuraminidase